MATISIDPGALMPLASSCGSIAAQVAGAAPTEAGGVDVVGDAVLAARLAEFTSTWSNRAQEIAADLEAAGQVLVAVAEAFTSADSGLAGG